MDTCQFSSTIFSLAVYSCTFSISAARATLLQGHLAQSIDIKRAGDSHSKTNLSTTSANQKKASWPDNVSSPMVPQYSALAPPANSYPRLYEGYWQCITTVTDSSVEKIGVGTHIDCEVTFFRNVDNRTCAYLISVAGRKQRRLYFVSANLRQ